MPDAENRRYFNLKIDVYVPGRWFMSEPTLLGGHELEDVWVFTRGERIEPPGQLFVPLLRSGRPLDFTTAGMGMTPILSERAAAVFGELSPTDVQLLPVGVEGQSEAYYLLVVAREVRCIDDNSCSEVRYFTIEDEMPERVGEYQMVSGLRIDKSLVGGVRVFKLWGWHPALIVAEEIKLALERAGISGGYFEEV